MSAGQRAAPPEFVPETPIRGGVHADGRFWSHLAAGELRMPRCAGCRAWTWPAHWRCGRCGSWSFDWEPVEARGSVYTWIRTWVPFDRTPDRHPDIPYVTVLIELPHAGGARMLGALEADTDDVRIGAPVVGEIRPPSPRALGYPSLVWRIAAGGHR